MKTAAEMRVAGTEAMCRAETDTWWPHIWRQTAETWFRLAELAEQRERDALEQRERAARQRWWKPWTW